MKIKRIEVDRVPGIDTPFAVDDMAAGLNVIIGPNGIGKSQLCRAVEALWLRDGTSHDGYRKTSLLLEHEGALWRVERDGPRCAWLKNSTEARPLIDMSPTHVSHFFLRLRDLLRPAIEAGGSLAEEIQLQMSGGFNLRSAQEGFVKSRSRSFGTKERRAFDVVAKTIRQAVDAQKKLSGQVARLGELKEKRDEAQREPRRINSFQDALALRKALGNLEDEERKLRDFPACVANLSGSESQQIYDLEQDLARAKSRLRGLENDKSEAQEEARKTNLEKPLSGSVLNAWRGQADQLSQVEDHLSRAITDCNDAEGQLDQAMKNGGFSAQDGELPSLSLEASAQVFQYLGDCQEKREKRARVQEELRSLGDTPTESPRGDAISQTQAGVQTLEAWLRVPDFSEGSEELETVPTKNQLLGSGAVFLLSGAYLGLQVHPSLWIFGGVGIALAIMAFAVRARGNERKIRSIHRAIQKRFPVRVGAPDSWNVDDVEDRLQALRLQLAELQVSYDESVVRKSRCEHAKSRLNVLNTEIEELEEEGAAMAAELGYENVLNHADLVNRIHALDRLRGAAEIENGKSLKLNELSIAFADSLANLAAEITPFGEVEPQDAAQAKSFVRSLESRSRALEAAQKDEKNANQGIQEAQSQIEELEEKVRRIYKLASLDVGEREALSNLSSMVERRGHLLQKTRDLKGEISTNRRRLREAKEESLAERTMDDLNSDMSRLKELAGRAAELEKDIAAINYEVKAARNGSTIERALAEKESCRLTLADKQGEILGAHAASFLLGRVREKHEKDQMPQVFAGAKQHFQTFTNFAYDLEMSFGDDPSFVAVETKSRKTLELEELSDGTRVQLILAAKLAFAVSVENELTMPLFLDEAMDHSDPVRFSAIAKSLAQMTKDGRQVFYCTNDATDIERLDRAFAEADAETAKVHDLGQIRQQVVSIGGAADVKLPPLPAVPEPGSLNFEDYAYALKIPRFSPYGGAAEQHIAYLLWDDLTLLHSFLALGIETVGQWNSGVRSGGGVFKRLGQEGDVGSQLAQRVELLVTFCRGWLIGRGRSIDRLIIEESGAVSSTYMERIVSLVEEEQGSALELMNILDKRKPGRPKGFPKAAREKLRDYLEEHGFIDSRSILSFSDILAQALATPAANLLPTQVFKEGIRFWSTASSTASGYS